LIPGIIKDDSEFKDETLATDKLTHYVKSGGEIVLSELLVGYD